MRRPNGSFGSPNLSNSVSQKLFQEAKWRESTNKTSVKRQDLDRKSMADSKKASQASQLILLTKQFKKVDQLFANCNANLEVDIGLSIEVFRQLGVFQKLESVQQLTGLQTQEICSLMQMEIKFVYLLWESIPFEESPVECFKDILKWLFSLRFSTLEIGTPDYLTEQLIGQLETVWRSIGIYNRPTLGKYNSHSNCVDNSQSRRELLRSPKAENTRKGPSKLKTQTSLKSIYLDPPVLKVNKGQDRVLCQDSSNYQSQAKSVDPEQLIARLYYPKCRQDRQNLMNQMKSEKVERELKQCTFKPVINKNVPAQSQCQGFQTRVKGYFKTVDRLREANGKHQENKKVKEHVPCGQNYLIMRNRTSNPPKFLNRRKGQLNPVVLSLRMEVCRKLVNITVRQGQDLAQVASQTCKIYHFSSEIQQQIVSVLQNQLSHAQKRLKTVI